MAHVRDARLFSKSFVLCFSVVVIVLCTALMPTTTTEELHFESIVPSYFFPQSTDIVDAMLLNETFGFSAQHIYKVEFHEAFVTINHNRSLNVLLTHYIRSLHLPLTEKIPETPANWKEG